MKRRSFDELADAIDMRKRTMASETSMVEAAQALREASLYAVKLRQIGEYVRNYGKPADPEAMVLLDGIRSILGATSEDEALIERCFANYQSLAAKVAPRRD